MAVVLRATRLEDGLDVAIKVLDPKLEQVLGRERFHREVAILTRLRHPAILPLLDSGYDAGFLYFVMPFVSGKTLRDRLRLEPQLPIDDAVAIATTVLDALGYAHAQNVIHRDIKPENILIEKGRPLLADFGIARAILRSGGESISSTGFVIGTPAYMSPEQAAGDARLDGRSDLYATGCLLYEMLSGHPPFTGQTAQAIRARHLLEPPPPLRVVRPAVPEALEAVIGKALAKVPGDRPGSAAAFSEALIRSLTEPVVPRARRKIRRVAAAVGILLAVGAAALLLRPRAAALDPERYLVLPFHQRGEDPVLELSGEDYSRLVWQTLSRKWRDLRLVDETIVEDRLRQAGVPDVTLSAGLELARSLGAGLLVWGETEQRGDSVHLRAALYRVDRGVDNAMQRAEVAIPAGSARNGAASTGVLFERVDELARGIVLPALAQSADQRTLVSTSYFQALRATLSGDSALVNWSLELARSKYREASAIDPQYAAPRLHFAQAALWANAPVSEWRPAAEAALASPSGLSALETLEAEGLVALGQGDFPKACQRFRSIIARDSLRFAGWFGLGECLARDSIVVPDSASASGWRFRGSTAAGVAAYIHALRLVPLSHLAYGGGAAFARLADKLHAESNRFRRGVSLARPQQGFAAYQSLEGDSIATLPYPIEEVLAGKRMPPTRGRALEAARRRLLELTSEWLSRYPDSPAAVEAHAWALELGGEITSPLPASPSALSLVRRLRARDGGAGRRIELGTWECRLLLKSRSFTAAGLLADSLLALEPAGEDDNLLQAGLAALTGRVYRSADLAALSPETFYVLPSGALVQVSRTVGAAAQRVLIYAAAGAPDDSIRAAAARVEQLVRHEIEPARQANVLEAVLFQPRLLGFPVLAAPGGQLEINRLEAAIGRADTAAARQTFAALMASRASRLARVPPDHVLLEARLYALLGDTAAARGRLESLFDGMADLGRDLIGLVTQAVAVPRAMAFYGALGGDVRVRGVDSALAALWKNADAPWRAQAGK